MLCVRSETYCTRTRGSICNNTILSRGIKGFFRLYEYGVRWSRMYTNEAQRRSDILRFWRRHGEDTTKEAFGVSRRILYIWQRNTREGNGHLSALNSKSRAPKRRRRRAWDQRIIDEIRRLRMAYPNLGKEKLYVFLNRYCKKEKLKCPSAKTIGRIADAPDKMRRVPLTSLRCHLLNSGTHLL